MGQQKQKHRKETKENNVSTKTTKIGGQSRRVF